MVGYPLPIDDLPPPPPGKLGWPWTASSPILPSTMPDGSPWPRISIVTPSFNQGSFIEETIRSILLQGYPNLEYIIIDGGSTDNSIEIIEKYSPWLDYWVSEKDHGQSHAINKGLSRCTGIWFNWVNSDDFLEPSALLNVTIAGKDYEMVAGVVNNFKDGFSELIVNQNLTSGNIVELGDKATYHQPSIWLLKSIVEECGGIDEKFQYSFDWDLMIRYLSSSSRIQYVPKVLCNFRLHSQSKTVSQSRMFHIERLQILHKLSQHPLVGKLCFYRLRQFSWWEKLETLTTMKNCTRWQRSLKIALAILQDPQVRFSRLSLGAIRRSLFG